MLGRSKSEDSVCNSSNNSSPVHGQVRVTYAQNRGPLNYRDSEVNSVSEQTSAHLKDHHAGGIGTHFFHATTGLTALKKKRKKFSSSKHICPVNESISTANTADLMNDKSLKRVSSYPATTADGGTQHKDAAILAKPRRHEQTQSQHDSVETSTEFTLTNEIQHLDPSNTSVNSREPLISSSYASTGGIIG